MIPVHNSYVIFQSTIRNQVTIHSKRILTQKEDKQDSHLIIISCPLHSYLSPILLFLKLFFNHFLVRKLLFPEQPMADNDTGHFKVNNLFLINGRRGCQVEGGGGN
jgi:hypothetical protein